jgi:hypothetical protein
MVKINKYMIIARDKNMRPYKIMSRHMTLATAKKKLQTIKLPSESKGADIVSISKWFKE